MPALSLEKSSRNSSLCCSLTHMRRWQGPWLISFGLSTQTCRCRRLFKSFGKLLGHVGITNWESKLIGFSCIDASVNIGARRLRGRLEGSVHCVLVSWGLTHCLELTPKDALKGTVFSTIEDMLLWVCSLYKKSPKMLPPKWNGGLTEVVIGPSWIPNTTTKGKGRLHTCGAHFMTHSHRFK